MKVDFEHRQSAHCESGVITSLLQNAGVGQITEPLSFGIGAGLFYVYIPFIKINNGPAIAFRTFPGLIFQRTCKALGIQMVRKKFRSKEKAEEFLKQTLADGQPAGCQVGVYYLSYFPREYRFHFNAHNLIVFGKEDDNYLISDPIMEHATTLTSYELERVRFAKGALAPKGQIYFPLKGQHPVDDERMRKAIVSGIKRNVNQMLRIPGWFAGTKGIDYTAKHIRKWRDKLGNEKAGLYLAQLVRMQEEIGTGGGGFRYIYAAFLQQAHAYVKRDEVLALSEKFTEAGDLWRTSAVQAAGIYKGRLGSQADFDQMADHLVEIAQIETAAFKALNNIKW